jgi:hypothetical protein
MKEWIDVKILKIKKFKEKNKFLIILLNMIKEKGMLLHLIALNYQ